MVIEASIKNSKFFRKYIDILNVVFNLSNREMDVLALLFEIDFNWHSQKFKNILDTSSRRYIMKETYVNKSNLSRYIATFKEKRILSETEDGWEVNRKFVPIIEEDENSKDKYTQILFNIKLSNEN